MEWKSTWTAQLARPRAGRGEDEGEEISHRLIRSARIGVVSPGGFAGNKQIGEAEASALSSGLGWKRGQPDAKNVGVGGVQSRRPVLTSRGFTFTAYY